MQSLKLFVLMLAVVVAAACTSKSEPEVSVVGGGPTFHPRAVVIKEPVSVPGAALMYVTVERFDEITEVRKVIVDNTVKFVVGDTVKLVMIDYRSSSTELPKVIWSIAK